VRGIQDLADQQRVCRHPSEHGPEAGQDHPLHLPPERKVRDGVIFSGGVIHGEKVLSTLKGATGKGVVIGRHKVDFPAVTIDNVGGAAEATQHLIDLDTETSASSEDPARRPRPGTASGLHEDPAPKRFRRGIAGGSGEADLTPSVDTRLRRAVAGKERPPGSSRPNDQIGLRAVKAVKEQGLRVPDDLSVVGLTIPAQLVLRSSSDDGGDPHVSPRVCCHGDVGEPHLRRGVERLKFFRTRLVVRRVHREEVLTRTEARGKFWKTFTSYDLPGMRESQNEKGESPCQN